MQRCWLGLSLGYRRACGDVGRLRAPAGIGNPAGSDCGAEEGNRLRCTDENPKRRRRIGFSGSSQLIWDAIRAEGHETLRAMAAELIIAAPFATFLTLSKRAITSAVWGERIR